MASLAAAAVTACLACGPGVAADVGGPLSSTASAHARRALSKLTGPTATHLRAAARQDAAMMGDSTVLRWLRAVHTTYGRFRAFLTAPPTSDSSRVVWVVEIKGRFKPSPTAPPVKPGPNAQSGNYYGWATLVIDAHSYQTIEAFSSLEALAIAKLGELRRL